MTETSQVKKGLVTPQNLKGFQDLLPENMIARNAIIEKIKNVYEKYGFLPLDTPILEYLVTLMGTGGEETNKLLFRLENPEHEAIAMRFDLTVPFARLLAQYPDSLKLPFRRYHIGPVFRADKPGPGRYRQFTQFDIDAAGSKSVAVDAEVIAAMCEVMKEVGLHNSENKGIRTQEFQVRVNNRKLVDALLEGCGITSGDTPRHVLRVIDKLQKVGLDNVRRELGEGRVDESGDPIKGVGLQPEVIDKILAFISISGNSRKSIIGELKGLLPDSEASETALQEMSVLAESLDSLNVKEIDVAFEPSLARGLDYYTGPIFEALLPSAPEYGSVMGGGRFDHLVERFLPTSIPATGASIGLDRFVAALNHLGKVGTPPTTTKVLVLSMQAVPVSELLKVASELRGENIATEVYFGGPNDGIRDQLSFANSRGIPIAVIIGEDEVREGKISVKDLKTGMESRKDIKDRKEFRKAGKSGQETIERANLVQTIQDLLR